MIKMAVTKGRIEKDVCKLLKESGFDVEPIENKGRELKIKTKDDMEFVFVKPKDVVRFIQKGIVDIGVVGNDTLQEYDSSEYSELLDLNVGKCFFALASYPEYKNKEYKAKKKIATKYPKIASKYFKEKNEDVEIIKMEGSVELGPIVGMTDAIVDIVETGSTLKANGLVVLDKISEVSTRLITNKTSLENKNDEICKIVNKLSNQIERRDNYAEEI